MMSYAVSGFLNRLHTLYHHLFVEPWIRRRNHGKLNRILEIGPGDYRITNAETLNVIWTPDTDYIGDARRIPFAPETFSLIYASHVLEHIPWYQTLDVLRDWYECLEPGGVVEIWVPDALKIAKAFVDAEEDRSSTTYCEDQWWRLNAERDSCVWFSGRMFSYGDGKGTVGHPNWHLAAFTARRLRNLLLQAGFVNITSLDKPRGMDHGWINLGVSARKPQPWENAE